MLNVMKTIKKIILLVSVILLSAGFAKQSQSQVFFIGFNAGPTYTWFNSPGVDNLVTADGWGHNIGFFMRYGKRPYYQIGFDWMRTKNEVVLHGGEEERSNDIPFHIFDFSIKVGYEIIQLPMFKLKAHAGPFIGRAFLLSNDDFDFKRSDFNNPQYGMIAGLGFQFTNLVVDLEYTYHINDLWKPIDFYGEQIKLESNLQLVTLKVGLMF
jgi:hypothetical protein